MRLFLIADLYSTIVAVVVMIAFIDRFKKYKTITQSKDSKQELSLKKGKFHFFIFFFFFFHQ